MMDLRALSRFVAVADAGGFRRASATTGVLQSVLSRTIRDLEETLGASLFERHRAGVRLTNAGRRYLGEVRVILSHLERANSVVRAAGAAAEGQIRVGVACSISAGFLHDLLRTWLAKHPVVSLTLREGSLQELVAAVVQRELDITFTTGAATPVGCDMEELWLDQIHLVTARTSSLLSRPTVSLADLAEEPFIVGQGNFGAEIREFLIRSFSDLGVSPTISIHDVGREVLFSMVGLGFGSTAVASTSVGPRYPDVRFLPITDVQIPFNAVWSPANDNPALRRFLSEARLLSRSWRSGERTTSVDC